MIWDHFRTWLGGVAEQAYRFLRGYCRPHCNFGNMQRIDSACGRCVYRCRSCGDRMIW